MNRVRSCWGKELDELEPVRSLRMKGKRTKIVGLLSLQLLWQHIGFHVEDISYQWKTFGTWRIGFGLITKFRKSSAAIKIAETLMNTLAADVLVKPVVGGALGFHCRCENTAV